MQRENHAYAFSPHLIMGQVFYGTDPWPTWHIHIYRPIWPITHYPLTHCLLWSRGDLAACADGRCPRGAVWLYTTVGVSLRRSHRAVSSQCLNCRGVGGFNPPSYFFNPASYLPKSHPRGVRSNPPTHHVHFISLLCLIPLAWAQNILVTHVEILPI